MTYCPRMAIKRGVEIITRFVSEVLVVLLSSSPTTGISPSPGTLLLPSIHRLSNNPLRGGHTKFEVAVLGEGTNTRPGVRIQ